MEDKEYKQLLERHRINPYMQDEMLYKYVDTATAKLILGNQTLRFTPPKEFNDPFELHKDLLIMGTNPKVISQLIKKHAPNLSRAQRRLYARPADKHSQILAHNTAMSKQKDTLGIFCACQNNDSTLMWSHYADKHKGVCIGLKLPSIDPKQMLFTLHVDYTNEIKGLQYFNKLGAADDIAFLKWATTKAKCWEYEKEVRSVHFLKNGLIDFSKETLFEIYYGLLTPQNEIKEIEEIISEKGFELKSYKMKETKHSFFLNSDLLK